MSSANNTHTSFLGRRWLIVGSVVAALSIAVVLVLMLAGGGGGGGY
jgi:hypothetical protein